MKPNIRELSTRFPIYKDETAVHDLNKLESNQKQFNPNYQLLNYTKTSLRQKKIEASSQILIMQPKLRKHLINRICNDSD